MRPCPAAPCWHLAVAVLSLALTGELTLAMTLALTLVLAPLPALAMALALALAMAAAMGPAVVTAVALALVGGGAAAGHVCAASRSAEQLLGAQPCTAVILGTHGQLCAADIHGPLSRSGARSGVPARSGTSTSSCAPSRSQASTSGSWARSSAPW